MSSMGSRGAWTSPRACVPLAIPTLMRKAFARTIRDVNVDAEGTETLGQSESLPFDGPVSRLI